MSEIKTLVFSIALCVIALVTPAQSNTASADDPLRNFAVCSGRLSAVMEYQWMFDGVASEQTKRQRALVLELINAIIEPDQGRTVLHWRLSAKHAQSVLLTRATFNDDPTDAAWAQQRATHLTQECIGLLLS